MVLCCLTTACDKGESSAQDGSLDVALGGVDSSSADAPPATLQGIVTYIKPSNTEADDQFGIRIALSGDGQTLAVGAPFEDSQATGIDGDQTDNSQSQSGAVYVYARNGGTWTQQAYVKASNSELGDRFGWALALSPDGSTLAVSAVNEASCATGIDGDQQSNSCGAEGAVYVFVRQNGVWAQQSYIKASNAGVSDGYGRAFGQGLAFSGDGTTLAVGGPGDSSAATGINGNQLDRSAAVAGAVYVFTRTGSSWAQQAYVKASNTGQQDVFGSSVALSADGNVMAVGAPGEWSSATGVNGYQGDNSMQDAGAVYMFTRSGTQWTQRAYIKASNTNGQDSFGGAVALSATGSTLVVGARGESSAATGIDGDQSDNSELGAGAVYVFQNSGSWAQQSYIKQARSTNGDGFGTTVAIAADGNTFAAGASSESGAGTGITTLQATMINNSGATYMFRRTGIAWAQLYYIKASNTDVSDTFGASVGLAHDSSVLAVSAFNEDSSATGVGGDQTNNSASASGAVYVIE